MKPENEHRAMQMASDFANHATLEEIYWRCIHENIGRDEWIQFCALFRADFPTTHRRENELRNQIESLLPKNSQRLTAELESVYLSNLATQETASFYLGVSWGKNLVPTIDKVDRLAANEKVQAAAPDLEEPDPGASLEEVVKQIINGVDESFPAALQPDEYFEQYVDGPHGSAAVELFLTTAESEKAFRRLHDLLKTAQKESGNVDLADPAAVMGPAYDWVRTQRVLPAAIAYCAGLRAAGLPIAATRRMMISFLRRFDRERK